MKGILQFISQNVSASVPNAFIFLHIRLDNRIRGQRRAKVVQNKIAEKRRNYPNP
jgi:hypothetical protein